MKKTRKKSIVRSMLKNPEVYGFQTIIDEKNHNLCGSCRSLYLAPKGEILCPNCNHSIWDDLSKIGPVDDLIEDHYGLYGDGDY